MTSLQPRDPYTQEELQKLYPKDLELQLVQVLLRHGERSPVSARFQNAGLHAYWPCCSVARQMISQTHEVGEGKWTPMEWRKRIETFGPNDNPVIAAGPGGDVDSICNLGELTDKGRETTWQLGRRLRHLYVDQLNYMPSMIHDADMIYLRASPIPRALESLQQAFWGMYPAETRAASFPPVTIITRAPADETLFPNDSSCRRLAQLSRAFAQRTADRWNKSDDMEYLNKMISKWMPESSKRVAIDSHPRLSGIMDTINSTLAHGPETKLPKEFYDVRGRQIIDKISVEEWFSGYTESREYRSLGIGSLMGDIVEQMVGSVEQNPNDQYREVGGKNGSLGEGRDGEKAIRLALRGCHDTTLAGILASLGAFDGEAWPPYTSHIAFEVFKKSGLQSQASIKAENKIARSTSWFGSLFSSGSPKKISTGIVRQRLETLGEPDRLKLNGYFVRIRYNDKVMSVPGCRPAGKHLDGDESFCTLEAFKRIVDKYTPANWKEACRSNLDVPAFPEKLEPSGY
ncbi:related to lysophosphatidic acid phosphatase [Rhynchosporium agropyri]|uniref:3-phytase n=1 Tax=Rhynchosporium agropyri TaxID=914238 RepID=A0A1E1KPA7_9HELO|nr:related to lysophosphatidic acid phosphatase [Rhynchosporium agropyri]